MHTKVTEAKKQNIETNNKRKNTANRQTDKRERGRRKRRRRDRSEPARDSGAKPELICTTQKTNKHTNAPSVPKERRDSREIVAAEQLMNRTKEEECCRDGRIYHNLVLLSSWWSAATHDLPCKRASQVQDPQSAGGIRIYRPELFPPHFFIICLYFLFLQLLLLLFLLILLLLLPRLAPPFVLFCNKTFCLCLLKVSSVLLAVW